MTWPATDDLAASASALGSGWVQLILNACLLALETQPGCRSLALQVTRQSGLSIVVEVRGAEGRAASVRDDLVAAVAGQVPPALSAKTVHGNIAGRMVRAAGGHISLAASGSGVTVSAVFPNIASASS